MGLPIGAGFRWVMDGAARFQRTGLQCQLIVKNFLDDDPVSGQAEDYIEVGVPLASTGTDTGVSLILIDPPPRVVEMSLHNIGQFQGRFNLGSVIVYVSHTFVLNQQLQYSIEDNIGVWRDRDGHKAVGIYYNNRLFSIESITNKALGGEAIDWKLVCNVQERQVSL